MPLAPTAAPGDVLFNATGTHLIGTEVGPASGPSFIDSFVVGSDGRLSPAPSSPFPAQAVGPFGSAFRPTNPTQLYVSNAHGGNNAGSVSAYSVSADGALTPLGASPYPAKQTAPLLGGDHARRAVPVHGQHGCALHRAVPDSR